MITASMDSTVRVWRTSDSFLLQAIPWTSNGYHSLDLGGDGRLLIAGGGKGDVLFLDTATETRLPWPGLPRHVGPVSRVAVLADGRHAVTLDDLNGRCAVWDVDLGAGRLRGLDPAADAGASLLAVATRPGDVAFALVVRDAALGNPSASAMPTGRPGTRSSCPCRPIAREPPGRSTSRPSASPMTRNGSSWGPKRGGSSSAIAGGIGPGPIARCPAARSGRSRSSRSGSWPAAADRCGSSRTQDGPAPSWRWANRSSSSSPRPMVVEWRPAASRGSCAPGRSRPRAGRSPSTWVGKWPATDSR